MAKTELVVAIGIHLYEVERPWGEVPGYVQVSSVSDVAVDSQDRVYLLQRSNPPVVVFDSAGKYLRSWGSGLIHDPHGISCYGDSVFLVDRDSHLVQQYDWQGNLKLTIGERHRPKFQAPLNAPTDVAVSPNGDIYVADGYGNSMIHWYSPEGTLRASWGKPGKEAGEFTTPHAVRVHPDGRVIVADRENDRVQVFTPEGTYLTEWRDFYHPMDIYIDKDGMIYISDQIPRISLLSPDGVLVGRCRPCLYTPHGIYGNSRGDLFLAEPPTVDRITRLARCTQS